MLLRISVPVMAIAAIVPCIIDVRVDENILVIVTSRLLEVVD